MVIHNTIKALRQKKGVTQEELAEAVGVSRQTIIAMEKGSYTPSLMLAMMLSRFFKISIEELFYLE
jgi:putative transcriptional regulator